MAAPSISPADKTANNPKGPRVSRALDLDAAETPGKYRDDQCLLDAMQLRTVEQPRFQRFKEMVENFEEAMAYKIAGKFENTTKAKACEWMRKEIGNPPPMDMFTVDQLYDLSIVSVGLAKYGADTLNELYDSGKMTGFRHIPVRSSQTRNENSQKAVRADYKKDREAAHRAGLDVVVKINLGLPRPHRVSEEVLKTVLNHPSNFRSETGRTNRGEKGVEGLHPKVDRKFLATHRGEAIERLMYDEVRRLNFIARFYQGGAFQTAMIENGGEHLYAAIREIVKTMDSSCWHGSLDRPELRESTVSLHLRKDGELDLRYAVNKGLQRSDLVAAAQAKRATTPAEERPTRARTQKDEKRSTLAKSPSSARPRSLREPTFTPSSTRPQRAATEAPPAPTSARLKKDGTPDMRFAVNRDAGSAQPPSPPPAKKSLLKTSTTIPARLSAPAPSVHLKRDGTPDMRYAENRASSKATAIPPERNTTRAPAYSAPIYSASTYSAPAPSYSSSSSGGGGGGREVFTGPRGGTYYINSNGNKSYI